MDLDDVFGGVDDNQGRERKQEKLIKGDVDSILGEEVVLVRLRGSWQDGIHQELICNLKSGTLIRISRTNGGDTFQAGAVETHEGKDGKAKPMPELRSNETHVSKRPFLVRDLLELFKRTRKGIRFYSQGDCQVFAQRIYQACTGVDPATGKFNASAHKLEDSY